MNKYNKMNIAFLDIFFFLKCNLRSQFTYRLTRRFTYSRCKGRNNPTPFIVGKEMKRSERNDKSSAKHASYAILHGGAEPECFLRKDRQKEMFYWAEGYQLFISASVTLFLHLSQESVKYRRHTKNLIQL